MTNDQPSGNDWVNQFIQGDTTVHSIVYDRFYFTMSYFASRIIHNQPAAQDIVSDCIYKMLERHQQFKSFPHLRSYLFKSVKNKCIDHLRSPGNKLRSSDAALDEDLPEADDSSYINLLLQAETMELIYQQIEKLPDKRRLILTLVFKEGLSLEEISKQLGIELSSVRSAKSQGLATLKTVFKDGKKLLSVCALLLARDQFTPK